MIDVSNRVFSNVKWYVQKQYPNAYFQNSATATPPEFPAVSVKQINGREVALDLGSGNFDDDYSVESSVEIQVYSNKNISESRKILMAACDAMRAMSYTRDYGIADIPNHQLPNLYRCVARFSRIVSEMDEVPKFTD